MEPTLRREDMAPGLPGGNAPAASRGFQLDLNLCTGCGACVVACTIENQLPWGSSWRWVDTFNEERLPGIPVHHLSLACNHCADAPCMEACPAVAYHRDPVTGAVLLDADRCIGCRYCTWACPYDAPRYDPQAGVVSKCTFCNSRQREGLAPACVNQCPTGALRIGDVDALAGESSAPGFPRTEARPSIRFVPLREGRGVEERRRTGGSSKASFREEWPLWLFSLTVAFLGGLLAGPTGRSVLTWPVFAAGMAVAAGASTLHLGKKTRAWRAVLGWRTSWLSREILLFNLLAATGTLYLAGLLPGGRGDTTVGLLLTLLAFATFYAIDQVYRVTRTPGVAGHSARVVLTGLLVPALAEGVTALWLFVLLFKLLLYGGRKHGFVREGRGWRPGLSALRVGASLAGASLLAGASASLLLLGPGAEVTATGGGNPVIGIVGILLLALGEAVDRGEFYQELTVTTPAAQIRTDLVATLRTLE